MRVARQYAVPNAPERPRVADPQRRRLIAEFLAGGTPVGALLHTDGVWVWPDRFVEDVLDEGLAPEPDLLERMRLLNYRAPSPAQDDRLTAGALQAWRAGPPRGPRLLVTHFVRVDAQTSPDRPLSLLRRVVDPAGHVDEQAVWRDLAWHPTNAFNSQRFGDELLEVTPEQAAAVLDLWCADWHTAALSRSSRA